MVKETWMFVGGVVVGVAVIYGAYRYYKHHKKTTSKKAVDNDVFAEKVKIKEEKAAKFRELLSQQTYVETLTSKDLTSWFRENANQIGEVVKMMVVTPTDEHLGGLGYIATDELDINTNVIQLIFEDNKDGKFKVLKTRLINFTDIDSNLQANLIEQDGMLIVTI